MTFRPLAFLAALAIALSGWLTSHAADLRWAPLNEPSAGGWITSLAVSPHDRNRVLIGGDILGIGLSEDRGESWQATFGLKNWEIADFTWHPIDTNTVWAGTMGGLYRSQDGGRNWTSVRTGFLPPDPGRYSTPIQKVLFDPNDATRLLAFGGNHREYSSPGTPDYGAVWASTNSGTNWKRLGAIKAGGNVMAAAFAAGSSTKVYAAVNDAGVYVSEDRGTNWVLRNAGLPHLHPKDLVVHPVLPDTLYVALWNSPQPGGGYTGGGIWWSTNAGGSWSPRNSGIRQNTGATDYFVTRMRALAISPANPSRLVTSDVAYDNAGIYLSGNGGATWSKRSVTPVFTSSGANYTGISADPTDANTFYAYQSEYCVRTTNNGASWTDVTSFRPSGAAGVRGRGYAGWVCTQFAWHPLDPARSTFTALDHGFGHQSRDGLNSWQRGTGLPQYQGAYDVAWSTNDTLYLNCGQFGSFSGVARSRDGGTTFQMLSGAGVGLPTTGQPLGIHALQDDPAQVWAVIGGKLWHSGNGGAHWTNQPCGTDPRWIAATPREPRQFFVSAQDGVYATTNRGTAFTRMTGSPAEAQRLAVDAWGRVYALPWRNNTTGGLWRFATNRWTRLRTDKFLACVAIDPFNPQRLMAGSNDHPYHDEQYATGIWTSEDDGVTWRQQNTGLAQLRIECLTVDPHDPDLWVLGTGGRGFFVARWAGLSIRAESSRPTWRLVGPVGESVRLDTTADFSGWSPVTTTSLPPHGLQIAPSLATGRAFFRGVRNP
jgi:photosystem II stability/assembly factor-like uncharacterized protein